MTILDLSVVHPVREFRVFDIGSPLGYFDTDAMRARIQDVSTNTILPTLATLRKDDVQYIVIDSITLGSLERFAPEAILALRASSIPILARPAVEWGSQSLIDAQIRDGCNLAHRLFGSDSSMCAMRTNHAQSVAQRIMYLHGAPVMPPHRSATRVMPFGLPLERSGMLFATHPPVPDDPLAKDFFSRCEGLLNTAEPSEFAMLLSSGFAAFQAQSNAHGFESVYDAFLSHMNILEDILHKSIKIVPLE